MRIAITGGTGFVGRNVARQLLEAGHDVVLISRGVDVRDESIRNAAGIRFVSIGTNDPQKLAEAFEGCSGVAHCAGINREIGEQTYQHVHIKGTQNVVEATKRSNVQKILLVSFLRARPNCGSGYHESKFAAEEIVRASSLDYTVLKCGVIYGKGDHMLDHLSHAFHTFPIFGLVGFKDKGVRPAAVEEVARVIVASLTEGRLSRETVAVVGPEEMPLSEAVRRVAKVVGKRRLMVRLPLWFHYGLAWIVERVMTVPMVSTAQIRMLSEGIVEPLPPTPFLPDNLSPKIRFSEDQIRNGLPTAKPFGVHDLKCPV